MIFRQSKKKSSPTRSTTSRSQSSFRARAKSTFEMLEDRRLLSFTPGNVVVYRIGTGTGSLVNTANAVFLDEYTPAGSFVQSVAMPTTTSGANARLIASGTATSEGLMTRSADGQYLIVPGYDRAVGQTGSIASTSGTAVPRVVGRVDAAGTVDTTTWFTDFASGNNPRSATSDDGTHIWVAGGAGGIREGDFGDTDHNSNDLTSVTQDNFRQLGIFGSQLYATSNQGTNTYKGVETIGSGLPLTGSQTITRLNGLTDTNTPSPFAFAFAD